MAPTTTATYLCKQYRVRAIGGIQEVKEQFYAITTDQHLQHPAVVALSRAAREDIFSPARRREPR
ncbi:hypothetical protein D3C86_2186630 [compost metagenome]